MQAGGVYYGDNAVYECLYTNNASPYNKPPGGTNVVPGKPPAWVTDSNSALQWLMTGNNGNPFYWVKVSDNFIGANERASYSCQKTIYEYALNKWFNTTFRKPLTPASSDSGSDIYITNNTINLPQFYFFPDSQASYFLPATNINTAGKPLSKYFFPSNVFSRQYDFTIYIPVAAYNAFLTAASPFGEAPVSAGPTTPGTKRNGIVRSFADLYCPAGAMYNIITY